jgi:hypothetical protein
MEEEIVARAVRWIYHTSGVRVDVMSAVWVWNGFR